MNSVHETPESGSRDGSNPTIGLEASPMADLIGVDVADPSNDRLIEEHRLQPTSTTGKGTLEIGQLYAIVERIRTKACKLGDELIDLLAAAHHDFAKGSRVDKAEFPTVIEHRNYVAMQRPRGSCGPNEQLTAHSKVNHHDGSRIEVQQEVLPLPLNLSHGRSGQPADDLLPRGSPRNSVSADLNREHSTPDYFPGQGRSNRLNLGQLGHRSASVVDARQGLACSCLLGNLLGPTSARPEDCRTRSDLDLEPLVVIGPGRQC